MPLAYLALLLIAPITLGVGLALRSAACLQAFLACVVGLAGLPLGIVALKARRPVPWVRIGQVYFLCVVYLIARGVALVRARAEGGSRLPPASAATGGSDSV